MRLRRVVLVGTLAASVLSFGAACSGGPGDGTAGVGGSAPAPSSPRASPEVKNPAALLARAQANAAAARSGAFQGTIADQGEQAQVSFKGTRDGSSVDVTKSAPKAGRVHLISVGGSVFVKADKTFWSTQNVPFLVSVAGDQFIKVPAGVVPVLDQLTLAAFVDRSIGTYSATDLPTQPAQAKLAGVDCWVLTTTSGRPADGALYVAKGTLEVMRFVGPASNPGQLDFAGWNTDLGVAAPPPDQVFSIG